MYIYAYKYSLNIYNFFPTVFSVFLLVYFNMVCVYVCTT